MKFGSLFSGIGGFDLGFERAGMECAWQCEIDPKAREVLRHHWGVPIYENVKEITRQNAETVDLICGGFPCQDVSIAGKRKGLAGERSGLWFEFARIIDELDLKWVVIENVPGLLSSNQGKDFAIIIQWLAERRYGVSWRVLDAQYFGVAQRRRRVFIVASAGTGDSATVLFESESLSGDPTEGRKTGEGIAREIAGSVASHYSKGVGSDDLNMVASTLTGGSHPGGLNGRDAENIHIVMATGQGGAEIECDKSPVLNCDHEAPIVAYKIRGGKEGGGKGYLGSEEKAFALHGVEDQRIGVRRFTPTECARLQGFPDDWNDWLADSARYRQYGNAVCVNVAEWIGKRIMELTK